MKRKLFILIAGVCLLLGIGLALSACGGGSVAECKHENATFTTTATCTEDGNTTWTCPDCNKTWTEEARALGHEYKELTEQALAASCTAPGKKVEICSRCDDVRTTEIPQLQHEYETNESLSSQVTCTTPGVTVQICKLCSDRKETYTPAKGHTWEGFECTGQHCTECTATLPATKSHRYVAGTPIAATCDTDGSTVYTCSVCSDTYTVTTPKTGHHYVITAESNAFEKKAGSNDCTYITSHTLQCDRCQDEKEETYEVVRHNYITKITREATCAVDGEKQTVCADCGVAKEGAETVIIPHNANAHIWEKDGDVVGSVQTYKCKNCTETKTAIVAAAEDAKQVAVNKEALTGADEVVLNGASIAMDATAKNSLPADKNLTLALEVAGEPDYDASLGEQLEGKDIYDITLNDGTGNITTFGDGGKITIRLPYELQDGEDVDAIVIWYVNGDKLEPMEATYSNGFVTFTTEHFSYYTVGKYTAAEMCEKYGHITVNRHKDATCFESGYDFDICTRCNAILTPEEERILPVRTHNWQTDQEKSKPATCTAAGVSVTACEYCGTELTTTLPALGHTWNLTDEGTAATCTASGKRVYQCETCNEKYTVTLPQLQHSFSAVVTEPTCTEDGYTTYTCTNAGCDYSYQGAKVAALGHRWNLDAPTCGEGQVCTVCEEKGLPATGKHSYGTDGVCTVCGQGCEHNFAEQETIPSTCRVPGYKRFICSRCGAEKREYLPLGEHDYQNGACTVCGARDEAASAFYENFLMSFASDSYTFRSEDFSYTYILEQRTIQSDFELLELRVQVTEQGKTLFAVHSITNETVTEKGMDPVKRKQESYMIYDGTYIYSKTVSGDRVSYSKEMGDPTGGASAGIQGALGVLGQESLQSYFSNLISANSGNISALVLAGADRFLDRTVKGSGYELTIDMAEFAAIVNDMKTLSVEKFIDKQFGEGSFADLTELLENVIFTLSVPDAVAALFDEVEEYGIEQDSLFALVEELIQLMAGEEISIDEMLSQYSEGTIAGLIEGAMHMEAGDFREQYNAILGMLKDDEYTVYDLFDEFIPMRGTSFSETVGTLFDEIVKDGVTTLTFTTDKEGHILSLAIGLDGFRMEQPSYVPDAEPDVIEAAGTATVLWDVDDIAVDSEFDVLTEPFKVLREKIEASGGTLRLEGDDVDYVRYEGGAERRIEQVWTIQDGKLCVAGTVKTTHVNDRYERPDGGYYEYVDEETVTFSVYDVEKMATEVSGDCGDWFSCEMGDYNTRYSATRTSFTREYNATGEMIDERQEWENSYQTYYGIEFFFDLTARNVAAVSQHKIHIDEDRSTTAEDVECEEDYYTYYVCETCGKDVSVQSHMKRHEWTQTLKLDEGATSCEQGVTLFDECTLCGATEEREHFTNHYQSSSYEEVETPHGTLRIYISACACGAQTSYSFYTEDSCRFEFTSREQLENGHTLERSNCIVSGCTAYMTEEYWDVYDPATCTREQHVIYRLYESEGKPMGREDGYTEDSVWADHTMGEATHNHEDFTIAENGYDGYRDERIYPSCTHGYRTVDEWHYDEFGRTIYRRSETYLGGQMTRGSVETYVFQGCNYIFTYQDLVDSENSYEDSGTQHHMQEQSRTEPTCTQYGYAVYSCDICGETEYRTDYYSSPRQHYFEGGVCIYCGLHSQQGNSGDVVLEDLTDYAKGSEYVVGVYHRSDPERLEYRFSLVYLNAQEEEVTEEVTLDALRRYSFDPAYFEDAEWMMRQSYMLAVDMAQVNGLINAEKGTFVGLRVTYLPVDGSDWEVISITLTDDAKAFREALQGKIAAGEGKYVIESDDTHEFFFTLGGNGDFVFHEGEIEKQFVQNEFREDVEYITYDVYYRETVYTLPSRIILMDAFEAEGWLCITLEGNATYTEKKTTQTEHYDGTDPDQKEPIVDGDGHWETTREEEWGISRTIYFNPATGEIA